MLIPQKSTFEILNKVYVYVTNKDKKIEQRLVTNDAATPPPHRQGRPGSGREVLIEAFVLLAMVVFIFLYDWRSTLISILAVAVSLIGTFLMLDAFAAGIFLVDKTLPAGFIPGKDQGMVYAIIQTPPVQRWKSQTKSPGNCKVSPPKSRVCSRYLTWRATRC